MLFQEIVLGRSFYFNQLCTNRVTVKLEKVKDYLISVKYTDIWYKQGNTSDIIIFFATILGSTICLCCRGLEFISDYFIISVGFEGAQ